MLDGERKATVVQFLYEAKLIGHIKQGVSEPIVVIVSLERANLNGANLNGVHLEMASLVGASLTEAHLEYAILAGANLKGAFLEKAHLTGANLDGANLELTNLSEAHLILASLKGASLKMAILDWARLDGGDFLDGARPDEATMLLDGTVTREQLAQTYSFEGAKLPFDLTPPALSVEASTPKEQARGRSEDAAARADHV